MNTVVREVVVREVTAAGLLFSAAVPSIALARKLSSISSISPVARSCIVLTVFVTSLAVVGELSRPYLPNRFGPDPSLCKKIYTLFQSIICASKCVLSMVSPRLVQYLFPKSQILPPLHPEPNPYPRKFKYEDWPAYLDYSWHQSFNEKISDDEAVRAEPKELVTPLHVAAANNNILGMQRSLALGLNVNACDFRGQSAAYWAAYFGQVKALETLRRFGAKLDEQDKRGKVPLRAAVKYARTDAIDYLLSCKVSLNQQDGRGLTPLHLAAYRGHMHIYTKLVMAGADETLRDPSGKTAKEVLRQKIEENYNNAWFFMKSFMKKEPPQMPLRPYLLTRLQEMQR